VSKISELEDGTPLVSSDYLIAVRSGGNVKVRLTSLDIDEVNLEDNEFIRLGNSQDLTMVHNASNSIINQAGVGDLLIQKAGATKLTINASGIDVTGGITATVTGNEDVLTLISTDADENSGPRLSLTRNSASPADNDYVGLIAFNGQNSAAESIRMGMIRTQVLDVTDGTEDSTLTFYSRHGGTETQRLATTATGIDVTGSVTADGLTVDGNARIEEIGAIAKLTLERGGSANAADSAAVDLLETNAGSEGANFGDAATNGFRLKLDGSANDFLIQSGASGTVNTRFGIDRDSGDISFYEDTGTTPKFFWDASAEALGIGTTLPSQLLELSGATAPAIRLTDTTYNQYAEISTANAGSLILKADVGNGGTGSTYIGFEVDGANEAMRIDASGNLLVGQNSSAVPGSGNTVTGISIAGQYDAITISRADAQGLIVNRNTSDGNLVDFNKDGTTVGSIGTIFDDLYIGTGDTNIRFDATNDAITPRGSGGSARPDAVDLGSSSVRFKDLHLSGTANVGALSANAGTGQISATFESTDAGSYINIIDSGSGAFGAMIGAVGDDMLFSPNNVEAMRISGGNLLVGQSSTALPGAGTTTEGISISGQYDAIFVSRASGVALSANRNSDGDIQQFRKDGETVGSIGSVSDSVYIDGGSSNYSVMLASDFRPRTSNGVANNDAAVDLGDSSARWKDLYRSGSTISTSDRNMKQDERDLTVAEATVAQACKSLLKAFRFIDAVEKDGDGARIHFGIVAQDLQAAFEAEGLDATDYAMFRPSTYTDENGNEQTRLGVCYENLLAFIIAAI